MNRSSNFPASLLKKDSLGEGDFLKLVGSRESLLDLSKIDVNDLGATKNLFNSNEGKKPKIKHTLS